MDKRHTDKRWLLVPCPRCGVVGRGCIKVRDVRPGQIIATAIHGERMKLLRAQGLFPLRTRKHSAVH